MTDDQTFPVGDDIKSNLVIPDAARERYPELIPKIIESTAMKDDDERNYWFSVLPIMTDKQVDELRDILSPQGDQASEKAKESFDLEKAEVIRREHLSDYQQKESVSRKHDYDEAENLLSALETIE